MRNLFWGLFLLLTFIITLPASWWALSKVDFTYSFLYDQIGISEHIATYAPRNNKNKKEFEFTTKAERVALFHGIVEAINNNGDGLVQLDYKDRQQQRIGLLTVAEIIHLRDVSNLLNKLKPLALGLLGVWLIIMIVLRFKRIKLPPAKQLLISTFIITLVVGGVLSFGPEKVFNQLHIWIFPDNHQWFFYYEESLMSTMMKAPDLFAYIAGIWVLLSMLFTSFILKIHPRF